MSYLDPERAPAPLDPAQFGFALSREDGGWRWVAYDLLGRVAEQGLSPTKALAAANLVRALSRT